MELPELYGFATQTQDELATLCNANLVCTGLFPVADARRCLLALLHKHEHTLKEHDAERSPRAAPAPAPAPKAAAAPPAFLRAVSLIQSTKVQHALSSFGPPGAWTSVLSVCCQYVVSLLLTCQCVVDRVMLRLPGQICRPADQRANAARVCCKSQGRRHDWPFHAASRRGNHSHR